jgi:hypothetical protein
MRRRSLEKADQDFADFTDGEGRDLTAKICGIRERWLRRS